MDPIEEHNIIPLAKLSKSCERIGYGTLDVTFQIHQKQIVSIEGRQAQRLTFKAGENSKSIAILLAELKDLHDTKRSGLFNYTVLYDKGEIKELVFNRNMKESFELSGEK